MLLDTCHKSPIRAYNNNCSCVSLCSGIYVVSVASLTPWSAKFDSAGTAKREYEKAKKKYQQLLKKQETLLRGEVSCGLLNTSSLRM